MNIQGWFLLGLIGLILHSKGLSRVFSNTTVWKHHSLVLSLLYGTALTSIHDHWKNYSFDYTIWHHTKFYPIGELQCNLNSWTHQIFYVRLWGLKELVEPWELEWDHLNGFSQICCCCSVAQLCLTLCDPIDCSMPGFHVLHHLLEFALTHVHWVGDAIQPSHPLSSPSPPALNFPSIRVFSNESAVCIRWSKNWSLSFSISPSNEYSGLISFRIDWLNLLAVQRTLKSPWASSLQHHSLKASGLWCSAFFMIQLSHPYMTTGKTIALTRWTFVSKVMSLLFNMLSRFVIGFLPSSKYLLISWLKSPSAVILEPKENKVCHCFHFFHIDLPWRDGTRCHDLSFLIKFEKLLILQVFLSVLPPPVEKTSLLLQEDVINNLTQGSFLPKGAYSSQDLLSPSLMASRLRSTLVSHSSSSGDKILKVWP